MRFQRSNGRATSRPRELAAAGVLLAAGLAGLAYGRLAEANDHGSWKEVWSTNFDGPAGHGVNRHYWRYGIRKKIIGHDETEVMTDSPKNIHLDEYGVSITAIHHGGEWTSGQIQTVRAFTPPAGGELRVIASLRQPDVANGRGYWPAFWMLGRGSWPAHGEIDIMEDVNGIIFPVRCPASLNWSLVRLGQSPSCCSRNGRIGRIVKHL